MPGSESRYGAYLEARERDGLRRGLTAIEARDARTIRIGKETYVNFAGNDYLALRFHPALINRAEAWAEEHGVGSGASRLVTGNLDLFAGIEAKVAALKQKQAALVMASGFQANASVLQALLDRSVLGAEPLVFSDRLNHASIHFGCAASGARETRYRHCDAAHLGSLLSQYQGDDRPKFILTESVFSMDGDIAPLAEIGRLAREHDAMLIVDDAHATGILGEGGRGLSGEADVVIGTFSKALGGFGAYVACSDTLRDYLINRCTGLIYSTALPPPVLGAIDAALDLVPSLDAERAHVASLAERFRLGARALGFDTGASTTQIVPLIARQQPCGSEFEQAAARRRLFRHRYQAADRACGDGAVEARFHRGPYRERHRRPAQCARRSRSAAQRHGVNRPTPKMHFVFVHGWGFQPRDLARCDRQYRKCGGHADRPRIHCRWTQGRSHLAERRHRRRPLPWSALAASPGRGGRATRPSAAWSASRASTASVLTFRRRGSPACGGGFAETPARPLHAFWRGCGT